MEDERRELKAFLALKRADARREGELYGNMLSVYRREGFGLLKGLAKYLELLCLIDPYDPPEDEAFWSKMRGALDEIDGYGGTSCLREELTGLTARAQKVRHAIEWTDGRRVSRTSPGRYTLSRGDGA